MLTGLGFVENYLVNTIKVRKLRNFGHIKRYNVLEKLIAEDLVLDKREKGVTLA